MKRLVLALAVANLLAFGVWGGWLGAFSETGREPARLAQQIAPERVRVLRAGEEIPGPQPVPGLPAVDTTPSAPGAPTDGAQPGASAPIAQLCMELGDFAPDAAAAMRAKLAPLALGARLTEVSVEAPTLYVVQLSPARTRADAERRLARLRSQSLGDVALVPDIATAKNVIALGSFRDPALAARRLAEVQRRGVRDVQIVPTAPEPGWTRFRAKDLDAQASALLEALHKEHPTSRLAACVAP